MPLNNFSKLSQKLHKLFNKAKTKIFKKMNLCLLKKTQLINLVKKRIQMLQNSIKWVKKSSLNCFFKIWIKIKNLTKKTLKKKVRVIKMNQKLERDILIKINCSWEMRGNMQTMVRQWFKMHTAWLVKLSCTLQLCGIETSFTN
jgi:hypothetical protein